MFTHELLVSTFLPFSHLVRFQKKKSLGQVDRPQFTPAGESRNWSHSLFPALECESQVTLLPRALRLLPHPYSPITLCHLFFFFSVLSFGGHLLAAFMHARPIQQVQSGNTSDACGGGVEGVNAQTKVWLGDLAAWRGVQTMYFVVELAW